ncbi:Chaperone protein ClpB [Bienertia sinuspersici]
MSWLPFSPQNPSNGDNQQIQHSSDFSSPSDHQATTPRGVKDDLSEFSKTLTRQFWGVASFLAPPPPSQISDRDQRTEDFDHDSADLVGITGIRNDLSEFGGKFRTGISKLSTNKAVSEFTKIATNILQFASEEALSIEEYAQRGVIGMTEEVVAFARDVAMHPETWIDFPLPDDDEDEDFDLSDAQQEHALAIERLAPEFGCP